MWDAEQPMQRGIDSAASGVRCCSLRWMAASSFASTERDGPRRNPAFRAQFEGQVLPRAALQLAKGASEA